MVGQACALARWVGRAGRPVTASRVLRRVDVAPAGSVLGVAVPGRVRTAADVPVLHRPWSFALGAGLLEIEGATVVAGPLLGRWSSLDDAEVLDAWLAGVRAVCAAESDRLVEVVTQRQEEDDWSHDVPLYALTQYLDQVTGDPFAGLVDLLGQLGAVTGENTQTATVTALGRWAVTHARAGRPRRITADLPADEVAELLAERVRRGEDPWSAVWRWLEPRAPAVAARELLTAAAGVSAAARIGAADVADGLGDEVLAVWREVEHIPQLGPHARAALVDWDASPCLEPVDAVVGGRVRRGCPGGAADLAAGAGAGDRHAR